MVIRNKCWSQKQKGKRIKASEAHFERNLHIMELTLLLHPSISLKKAKETHDYQVLLVHIKCPTPVFTTALRRLK
jgi:hypothetical protein